MIIVTVVHHLHIKSNMSHNVIKYVHQLIPHYVKVSTWSSKKGLATKQTYQRMRLWECDSITPKVSNQDAKTVTE